MTAVLAIFFRWLHLATAAVAVGGVFYARIIVPIALRSASADDLGVRQLLLRARRAFKMTTHTCILFLLVSGTYNTVLNWPAYTALGPAVGHSLWGTHVLLGLAVFGLLLWLYVGAEPRPAVLRGLAVTLGLMLLSIAVASTLKYAREHAAHTLAATPNGVPVAADGR